MSRSVILLLVVSACGAVEGEDPLVDAGATDAALAVDARAPGDAARACTHDQLFGAAERLVGVNTRGVIELNAWLTADERTIVFNRMADGLHGDLLVARRAAIGDDFGATSSLGATINTAANEYKASMSADGLTVYFDRQEGTTGPYTLYRATWTDGAFGPPEPLAEAVNAPGSSNFEPFVTADALYFGSVRDGQSDANLYVARRQGDGFATAEPLDTINTVRPEEVPTPSADGLAVYYVRRDLPGDAEQKGLDIWVATRASPSADFGNPRRISELSKPGSDAPSWISPDNCRLYFASDRDGDLDLYVASRSPE